MAYQGSTPSVTISAASTNATSVKATAGNIFSIQAFSIDATPVYLKLYDDSAAPTVGTDTPIKVLLIPGDSVKGNGFTYQPSRGLSFSNGIAFAITGGIANNDTTAIAASEVVINIDYE